QKLRHWLPEWFPLIGPELGYTNIVPVDFVAAAMDHIAHQPDLDGQAFHLTSPKSQRSGAVLNTFARAAHAPQLGLRVDKRLLVARSADKLEETRQEIEAQGGTAYTYSADLSDLDSIDGLVEQVLSDHPAVDVLVNNAGRSIRRSIALSFDRFHDFERTIQLNYLGTIKLTMGLLPHMRERGAGHIVNVSSIGVQTNPPRVSAYVA